MKRWMLAVGMGCSFAGAVFARDIYVSPQGAAGGDGSKDKPIDVFTALEAKASPAKPGDTIYLMPGRYDGRLEKTKRIPFEVGVSGTSDKPILVRPAPGIPPWAGPHLNGTIHVTASYLHLIGLDIGDLDWDPYEEKHQAATVLWATDGTGAQVINCNLFGGAMGSGIWKGAIDFELYGTLIHDYGELERKGGRGHGHAVYTQNTVGTKTYQHDLFYRGCGWNFDIYTQGSDVKGFDVLENISYIGGWYAPGQVSFSFGVGGYQAADQIRFVGNVAYQPRFGEEWRANARMLAHSNAKVIHETGTFNDNYVMGAYRAFSVSRWKSLTVKSNTFWATGMLFDLASAPGGSGINDPKLPKPDLKDYHIDDNTYFANGKPEPFRYGGGQEKTQPGELLTFAQWQKLGLDAHSKLVTGKNDKPTGTKVFVFANKVEKGRANVAIFNWDGQDRVAADLGAALAKGRKYRVYNALDIKQTIASAKPVLTGTYDGKPVSIPMRKDKDCPDFDAFLVLPE